MVSRPCWRAVGQEPPAFLQPKSRGIAVVMRTDADKLVFLGRLAAGVAVIVAGAWIVGLVQLLASPEYGGEALDVDFSAYWAAAKLTIAEGPLVPFDMERRNAARGLPPDIETAPMLWLYPPGWLTVVLPLVSGSPAWCRW